MSHSFQCPHCQKQLKTNSPRPGTTVTCPGCQQQFTMPFVAISMTQQTHDDLSPPTPAPAQTPLQQVVDAHVVPPTPQPSASQPIIPQPSIQAQLNDATAQLGEAARKLKTQAMPVINELAKNLPQDATKRNVLIIAASLVGGLMLMCCCGGGGLLFLMGGGDQERRGSTTEVSTTSAPTGSRRRTGPLRSKHDVRAKLDEIKDSGRVDDVMTFAFCKYGVFMETFGKPESEVSLPDHNKLWKYSFQDGNVVLNISIAQYFKVKPSGEQVIDPENSKIIVNSMDIF